MTGSDHEIGVVKTVSEDRTIVELQPGEVCESCSARIICRPGKSGAHEMAVLNTIGARPGEVVELDETGNLLLILSLMQYGLPLLGLLSGVFLVYGLNLALFSIRFELLMATAGLFGLLLGGVLAYLGLGYLSRRIGNVFKITAIQTTRK